MSEKNLMDESERADVLKTRITEEAQTERAKVAEKEATNRARINSTEHHFSRGMIAFFVAIASTIVLTCAINAWMEVNKPHAAPSAPASASTSAFAPPVASAKVAP